MDNKDKMKEKAAKLAVAYSKVFESEDGKTVLFDLMGVVQFNRTPYSPDPYETAYIAGRQSIIHEIVRAMNLDLEKYLEVIVDSNKEQENFND